jgi:hypothetical protein
MNKHHQGEKMKARVTLTIDPSVLAQGKLAAGMVPLSRWIENLVAKEIKSKRLDQERERKVD